MDIKELLKQQTDMITGLVKCLSDGDVDGAIDLLKASADKVSEQVEKAEETPAEPTEPTDDGGEPAEPATEPTDDGGDNDGGEPSEPVEKTVTLTKTQADALAIVESIGVEKLQKWADLWVGASDLPDLIEQLSDATERLAKLEKQGKQDPEDLEKKEKSTLSGVLSV